MPTSDIITLIGIIATLLVSVGNFIYSVRNNRRTTFVNTVTASRLKWIDSLRDKVSEFIAVNACLAKPSALSQSDEELRLRRDTLLHQITLHLNPNDAEDLKLKALAMRASKLSDHTDDSGALREHLTELRDATGLYLKKEWGRVKNESQGNP